MTTGKFIALEGGEGAGKSTQARLLAEALRARGIEVVVTREPGGTPGAEAIRALLLGLDGEDWNPRAEALLFAAARSDHVERLIVPAVAEGKWVICDRFVDSSRAYQGGGGGLSDAEVLALHRIGSCGLLPDLTLLIEISPDEAAARLSRRDPDGSDRIGGRDAAYHARVAAAFAQFAAAEPARFARIDGNGDIDANSRRDTRGSVPAAGGRIMTLAGHDAAWHEWRAAMASARMHHGWILAGIKSVGKGAFARAAARELLTESGIPQPEGEYHPDIIVLDHLPANDDEEKKRADGKPFQLKRNITIDQIRRMQLRLNTRPTLGSRRAVIIDPSDDMEKGAVNALLKSLEEPPAGTFFLLVAHRPGRLLPTIRSRCRMLRFAPLGGEEIDKVLRREAPEADSGARAAAIAAAEGSPGAALAFVAQNLAPLHDLMQRIIREGDDGLVLRGALAGEVGARPDRERIAAALDLARATLAEDLATAPRERQARIIEAHGAITRLAAQAPTYNFDPALLVMEIGGLLAKAALPRETAS